jgi:RNA polymerase sigma-70 factor (ECF subfamily)
MADMSVSSRSSGSLSSTLLVRLRDHDPDAWRRLTHVFGPLVYGWCRGAGLAAPDAADVTQDIFRSVAAGLPRFRRDRPGDSFRGWLATISQNRIRDHFRRTKREAPAHGGTDFLQQMHNVPDQEIASHLDGSAATDPESRGIVRRALELVRAEFEPTTWTAFWRTTVDGAVPADAAAELGVSVNAVYKAKSRVLRRLRDELDGLLD